MVFPIIHQLVKNLLTEDLISIPGSGRSTGEGIGYPFQYSWASLVAQWVKNPPATGDHSVIPESGRSSGEGIGYTLQYSWASLMVQLVRNLPAIRETTIRSLVWEIPWRRERLLEKTLMLVKIKGRRRRGQERIR